MIRATIFVVLTLLIAATAAAVDLSAMTDRQYTEYVRDRFESLVGEGRTSHRMEIEYAHRCERQTRSGGEDASACQVAEVARERCHAIVDEETELMRGVRERFGRVPGWARDANAALEAALRS